MAALQSHPFTMGTSICPVCGFMLPLSADQISKHLYCRHCASALIPKQQSDDELYHFSDADVRAAINFVTLSAEAAGHMPLSHVSDHDHRVLEEAFCERCNTHRPCRTFARQTRSADEGQTIFLTCTVCKSEWSLNS